MGHGKPSDWIDTPGEERSWTKILLLGSAGCLVLFIAAAALSTWGTCAGISSCCENAQRSHKAMAKPVQDLLDAVGNRDTQRAYLGLSTSYQKRHSQEEFDAFIAEHESKTCSVQPPISIQRWVPGTSATGTFSA